LFEAVRILASMIAVEEEFGGGGGEGEMEEGFMKEIAGS
jgi:hypothetical protein